MWGRGKGRSLSCEKWIVRVDMQRTVKSNEDVTAIIVEMLVIQAGW